MAQNAFLSSDIESEFPAGEKLENADFPLVDLDDRKKELGYSISPNMPSWFDGSEKEIISENFEYNFEEKRDALASTVTVPKNPAELLSSSSSAEVSAWLQKSWETFDFEQFTFETSEEKEVFKQGVVTALHKISVFLKQAQQLPDFSQVQSPEFTAELYESMTGNINAIWEEEMNDVFSGEPFSLEEVFGGLLLAQMDYATQNPNAPSALRDEHFANGGTGKEWEEKVESNVAHQKTIKDEKEKEISETLSSVSTSEVGLPDPKASYDEYLSQGRKWVLNGLGKGGRFEYLNGGENGIDEPFAEVIGFVTSGGKTKLSQKAYEAMTSMLEDGSRTETQKKWVDNKIEKAQRKYDQYNNVSEKGPKKDKKKKKYESAQGDVFNSDRMYQLIMKDFAKDAKSLMNGKPEDYVESPSGESAKDYIDFLKTRTHKDGYAVKNIHSDKADSSLSAQITGRFTGENLLLDQVVRSGALIMVVTNVLIGFNTGKWASVAPYILGGTGAMMALKEGVINGGIGKLREPEKMLNHIVQESSNNRNYPEYFGNEWEMALANAIEWPEPSRKSEMKKDLKAVKKKQKVESIVMPDGTPREPTIMDNKVVNKFEKNIDANAFNTGCDLEKYLPGDSIPGPNGVMMKKEKFLAELKNKGVGGDIRYEMLNNTAGRIGKKDSYLPHLHQLHEHYKKNNIRTKLDKFKEKATEI